MSLSVIKPNQRWLHNQMNLRLVVEIIDYGIPNNDFDECVTVMVKEYDIAGYTDYVYNMSENDLLSNFTCIVDLPQGKPRWEI